MLASLVALLWAWTWAAVFLVRSALLWAWARAASFLDLDCSIEPGPLHFGFGPFLFGPELLHCRPGPLWFGPGLLYVGACFAIPWARTALLLVAAEIILRTMHNDLHHPNRLHKNFYPGPRWQNIAFFAGVLDFSPIGPGGEKKFNRGAR